MVNGLPESPYHLIGFDFVCHFFINIRFDGDIAAIIKVANGVRAPGISGVDQLIERNQVAVLCRQSIFKDFTDLTQIVFSRQTDVDFFAQIAEVGDDLTVNQEPSVCPMTFGSIPVRCTAALLICRSRVFCPGRLLSEIS